MRFTAWVMGWGLAAMALPAGAPVEPAKSLSFAELDAPTMERLLQSGSLLLVRQKPDGKLKEVLAGGLVNAPLDLAWQTVGDYDHYAEFMPNTVAARVVERKGEDDIVMEQTIEVIISVLKVKLTYRLHQVGEPRSRIRFDHVSGDLPGTHGGWDFVPTSDGRQTMIFYTLYSNLMALPWPVGAILKAQPDFMTAVNVTTAMLVVKNIKQEVEKRAKAQGAK